MELVNKDGLTEQEFLAKYDDSQYEKPSVTADMVIFTINDEEQDNYRKLPEKKLQILMIKRGDHPCINQWAIPGGFAHVDEDLDATAYRELKEETNIDNIYMEQLYTWGEVKRDPRTRVISTSYLALVNSEELKQMQAGDDAADAKWFNVSAKVISEVKSISSGNGFDGSTLYIKTVELTLKSGDIELKTIVNENKVAKNGVVKVWYDILESGGIAFDHAKIIYYSLQRLRNKVEYTNIAFNLMPELFTLTELQQVYEIILDKELLTANFRRKIADMVIETKHIKQDKGHRPSKLFKFNEKWIEENI